MPEFAATMPAKSHSLRQCEPPFAQPLGLPVSSGIAIPQIAQPALAKPQPTQVGAKAEMEPSTQRKSLQATQI